MLQPLQHRVALLGQVGIAVNGLPFYGPNEGPFPDPFGDPVFNGIMDECAGHTGGNADYHFHTLIESCLTDGDVDTTAPSGIIGFSFDGFPIYGPRGCLDEDCSEVVEFNSSYQNSSIQADTIGCTNSSVCDQSACDDGECVTCGELMYEGEVVTACADMDYAWDVNAYVAMDGDTFLDECNGRTQPDGSYAYHVTATFPYILGCYRGTVRDNGGGGPGDGGGPPGGGPPGGGVR